MEDDAQEAEGVIITGNEWLKEGLYASFTSLPVMCSISNSRH